MKPKSKIADEFWGGYEAPESSYVLPSRKRGRKRPVKNRSAAVLKELARSYCTEAIEIVVELMRCSESEHMQLAVAEFLFDRGIGKVGSTSDDTSSTGVLGTINVQFVKAADHEFPGEIPTIIHAKQIQSG